MVWFKLVFTSKAGVAPFFTQCVHRGSTEAVENNTKNEHQLNSNQKGTFQRTFPPTLQGFNFIEKPFMGFPDWVSRNQRLKCPDRLDQALVT
eukprot:6270359-Amphidinium_carterae.1